MICQLAKIKITIAVTGSTAAGFFLFAEKLDPAVLLPMAGVFMLACGCSALNQAQEARIDARMPRTQNRPIPSGRLDIATAVFIAVTMIMSGFVLLATIDRHIWTIMLLAGLALGWYNIVYTYLKRVTAFAVVIGALIGAIPPAIGWVAAGGKLTDPMILLVGSFFFIWQIPHFWLLLLMRGREYEQAGLASPTRRLSPDQLYRITFMWISAAAAAGMLLALLTGIDLPWKAAILICSLWVAGKALPFLRPNPDKSQIRTAFFQLIIYATLITTILTLQAVL